MNAEAIDISLKYEPKEHAGKPVIFIRFDYDQDLNQRIKAFVGAKWSRTEKAWYVADNAAYRQKFGIESKPAGTKLLNRIHEANKQAFIAFIETLQLKAYSKEHHCYPTAANLPNCCCY